MPDTRLLFLPALLWTACASPSPTLGSTESLDLDRTWESDAGGPAPEGTLAEDWWTAFASPELDAAVSATLDNNFDLMAAAARVQSVAAQARAVAGDRLPEVNAGLDLSRSRQNFIGLPIPGGPEVLPVTSDRHALGLDLRWELDLWGRLEAQEEAAVASLKASDADFAAARLSLAGQAAKAWLTRQEALMQQELAQAQLRNAEDQKAYADLRFRHGAPADLVLQSEAALSMARTGLPARAQQVQTWDRQLAVLAGRYPSRTLDPERILPSLPGPAPMGLPAQLVARRPDLASLEAKVRSAYATGRAADASLYPALALTGSGGTTTAELQDLLDADFKTWSLGASLTAPLFHGGTLKAQAEAAESRAHALELQFAQALLRALAEVEITLDNERLIQERIRFLASQHEAVVARQRLALDRFQSGIGDASQVYSTRAEALTLESSLLSAELLLLTNRIDLYLALGGGFQNPHQP